MEVQKSLPKRKHVNRLDSIRLDAEDRTYFTAEGYLIDHPILTSVGIFEYKNPDGSIRRELRLPEYVFAKQSLKTYKGKPIIITHEAGVVSKDNVDHEQIGTILSEGYQDGENVRAEIIIHNTDAMKNCGLKELSLGYNLDLIEEPGKWEGEPYDAIQTNIVVNHLALVAVARAGDQARLNIDGFDSPEVKGSKVNAAGVDEIKKEGGKQIMQKQEVHTDSMDMTPEELVEAIMMYKASKAEEGGTEGAVVSAAAEDGKAAINGTKEPNGAEAPVSSSEPPAAKTSVVEPAGMEETKKDDGMQSVISALESLIAMLKPNMETQRDSTGSAQDFSENTEDQNALPAKHLQDPPQTLNADSADELFRKRLELCRIGDRLGLRDMEKKSILEGKKVIVAKVLPDMRLDGRDMAYVDAAYDLAVTEVNKRRGISYQIQQMTVGALGTTERLDGSDGSMARSARQRMIEREGGNQ